MNGSGFFLRIQRSTPDPEAQQVWLVTIDDSDVTVTHPDGNSTHLPAAVDVLDTLTLISDMAPGINVVRVGEPCTIECSGEVESVLPLWLQASTDPGAGGTVDDAYVEALEDHDTDLPLSSEHFVFVNGTQWAAWQGEDPHSQPVWVIAPFRDLWFSDFYGSFDFTETGNMTSGWDVSECGLISERVFSTVDRFDEGPVYLSVRLATDPVSDFRDWMRSSELASQLREIWPPFPNCDDFIEWGFLQLAKSGGTDLTLWGAETDDGDEDPPNGLTSTSRWTFNCILSSETLRQALGEMKDRRPTNPDL